MNKIITLLFCLILPFPALADTLTGKVIKITDGDTAHVLQKDHTKEKIRLAGIDAPERKQPYGKKAKHYLASLIGNKFVSVEYSKRDRYGRIVGKIIHNALDVNLEMVKAGYAWHYKKYQKEQLADDRLSYRVAENSARLHKVGLFQNEAVDERNQRMAFQYTRKWMKMVLFTVKVLPLAMFMTLKNVTPYSLETKVHCMRMPPIAQKKRERH